MCILIIYTDLSCEYTIPVFHWRCQCIVFLFALEGDRSFYVFTLSASRVNYCRSQYSPLITVGDCGVITDVNNGEIFK